MGHQQASGAQQEPYRLRAVGHSLGGASLLIYAVTRSMKGRPTHLSRLILLTPAGFQQNYPKARHTDSTESRAVKSCCLLLWTLTCTTVNGGIATVESHQKLPDGCSLMCLMTRCQQGNFSAKRTLVPPTGCCPFLMGVAPPGMGSALDQTRGGGRLLHPLLPAAICHLQTDGGHAADSCLE